MKKPVAFFLSLFIIYHITTAGGCKKDDAPPPTPDTGTVTDVEGNVYKTIKIGTQVWMAENLKTAKYRNGDPINLVTGEIAWRSLNASKTPAYTYSEFNVINAGLYGHLYNWYAVNDSRSIAPSGWHIPTDAEWTLLIDYLGGKNTITGNKMKATSTWFLPNNGNNNSGFTALAAGAIDLDGRYIAVQNIGAFTTWWSATAANDPVNNTAFVRRIFYDATVTATATMPNYGLSVRCIKD